jgi:hypothetical protein
VNVKKHLFWLICALVVIVGAVLWGITVPGMWGEADQAKQDCLKEAETLVNLAAKAKDGDAVTTPAHVKQAEGYARKLAEQVEAVKGKLAEMKLDVRFADAPAESTKFDTWLATKRDEIRLRAKTAGLDLPADFDRLTFKETSTDDRANAEPERRREYRLRQLAIVEEVVNILCRKYGKAPVLKFQQEAAATEAQDLADIGPLALEKLSIIPTRGAARAGAPAGPAGPALPRAGAGGGVGASAAFAEDRIASWQGDAFRRSGRPAPIALRSIPYQELPYNITTVDVQFVAPLAAIPGVAHALEASDRYTAVVTRMDCQRAAPPYPAATDAKLAKAEHVPALNTHYGEGPVRALVTLDLMEYDKAKAEKPRDTTPVKATKKGGK